MSVYFPTARSRCKKRAPIIVSKEKGMEHIAKNENSCEVRHYKVDGELITSSETVKCDFLVLNDTVRTAYFIELKRGGQIGKAINQIEMTIGLLRNELPGYIHHCRVISKTSPAVYHSETIDYKKKCLKLKGSFVVCSKGTYTENI